MKMHSCLVAALTLAFAGSVDAQIEPGELVAPKLGIFGGNLHFTVQQSVSGRNYQLQCSDTMAGGTWTNVGVVRVGDGAPLVITTPHVPTVAHRFYRLAIDATPPVPPVPSEFALIPAGEFQMGDQSNPLVGESDELPVHTVQVSAFYMGRCEVTKEEWDAVRAWGLGNGYTDLPTGVGKAANHPVHSISWHEMAKWCNARSQKEGLMPCYITTGGGIYITGNKFPTCIWSANGYRLPTEAEWEKAARGGASGQNFPWGNTITHSQANYYSSSSKSYDVSPTRGDHPSFNDGVFPFSAPVGSFAPNGYGLYDMAGNMWEWCWDWNMAYTTDSQIDPRGAASGSYRVIRGGSWNDNAYYARCARRRTYDINPTNMYSNSIGFRLARSRLL